MKSFHPYQKRSICFLEIYEFSDWKLKVYGISQKSDLPNDKLVSIAKKLARDTLSSPETNESYRIGFLGIHEGRDANFIFLDYWSNENELRHYVFVSSKENPLEFIDQTSISLLACVWDLEVIYFERCAWIRHILKKSDHPDFSAYLEETFCQKI